MHKHVAVESGRGFRGVASKVIDAYEIHCCSLFYLFALLKQRKAAFKY